MLTGIVTILFGILLSTIVHMLCCVILALRSNIIIEDCSLFMGPRVLSTTIAGVPCSLRLIPTGSYVRLEKHSFEQSTVLQKTCLLLLGWVMVAVLSMAILGLDSGLDAFSSGFSQVVSGALAPLERGTVLVRAAGTFVTQNSFSVIVGVVLAKTAAVHLLPVPAVGGGQFLLLLFKSVFRWSEDTDTRFSMVGLAITLLLTGAWLVALVAVLRS